MDNEEWGLSPIDSRGRGSLSFLYRILMAFLSLSLLSGGARTGGGYPPMIMYVTHSLGQAPGARAPSTHSGLSLIMSYTRWVSSSK
jgi:hypothetical protein